MAETKITKVKYVVQYKRVNTEWEKSDWNDEGVIRESEALALLKEARDNMARCFEYLGQDTRTYRLIKQTHSITTEVVNA